MAARALLCRAADYVFCQPNPLQQIFYLLLVVGGYSAFLFAGAPRLPTASLGRLHVYLWRRVGCWNTTSALTTSGSFALVVSW